MFYYFTLGIILGFSAGFSPGPLLTLVISETMEHGIGAGIRVALTPVVTDIPIILLAFLFLQGISGVDMLLGIISLIGSAYVFYMAYESFRTKQEEREGSNIVSKSLTKGVLTNALSPHPYLFWISVGIPILNNSLAVSLFATLLFIFGFYLFLIGAKMALALFVGRSKGFFSGKSYLYTMRGLGIILGGFAMILLVDGLKLLGVL